MNWFDLPHAPAPGTELGCLEDFVDGGVRELRFGSDPEFRLLVLRSGREFFAYVNRCAHFGVPLAAEAESLITEPHCSLSCNVHYARYRWRDGVCEFGDCEGESLLGVPLAHAEGILRIG